MDGWMGVRMIGWMDAYLNQNIMQSKGGWLWDKLNLVACLFVHFNQSLCTENGPDLGGLAGYNIHFLSATKVLPVLKSD